MATQKQAQETESEIILEARDIRKEFGEVIANDGVDFTLSTGEIHSILGENGAGKTTFMKILFGMYERDSGEILYKGEPINFASPADALANGVGLVHQEFKLIPSFTVLENILLGYPDESWYTVEKETFEGEIAALSEEYGLGLEDRLDWQISDLSEGEKQRVEILKILYRDVDVLLLDEPTSILTPNEVDRLFDVLQILVREEDLAIVFITHKLDETLAISDRITVFRDGQVVGTTHPEDADQSKLAQMMVGEEDVTLVERREFASTTQKPRLNVESLTVKNDRGMIAVDTLSFDLRSGEVLGVVGIEGNGQRELVEGLTGLRSIESGEIELSGTDITGLSREQSRKEGITLIPDTHGLIGEFTVADNCILDDYIDYYDSWVRQEERIRQRAQDIIDAFGVSPPNIDLLAKQFSGGNKQKVVVGRKLTGGDPDVIVAFNPTKGLDIDTKGFIHDRLVEERDSGTSVLLVTTDMDEAFAISDRLVALNEGRFMEVYEDVESTTKEEIGIEITR